MPVFDPNTHVTSRAIVADKSGRLWLVDVNAGDVRPAKVHEAPVVDPLEKTDGQAPA